MDQFQPHQEWVGGPNKEQFRSRNRLGKSIKFKEKGEGPQAKGVEALSHSGLRGQGCCPC